MMIEYISFTTSSSHGLPDVIAALEQNLLEIVVAAAEMAELC